MRFLILNTDYDDFLRSFHAQNPGLEKRTYSEQMQARNDSLFGVADFYSSNLQNLGHEACEIHANNLYLQSAWARENGLKVHSGWNLHFRLRKKIIPWLSLARSNRWFYDILAAQIKHLRPDVLLNQAMDGISSRFMNAMKPEVRLLVGQTAAPLPKGEDFRCYDLIISAAPHFVTNFRKIGLRAEHSRLAFEPRVLNKLKKNAKGAAVSFVGSLSPFHQDRFQLLEYLCKHTNITVWTKQDTLPDHSPIRPRSRPQVWGTEMYNVLHNSQMTVNQHISIAEEYAANMRLFEATGAGTLLITDWKKNLHEMFEPGKEVVAYRTHEECAELVTYYIEHEAERTAIARAGQQRTLREHTYYQRVQELVDIVRQYL